MGEFCVSLRRGGVLHVTSQGTTETYVLVPEFVEYFVGVENRPPATSLVFSGVISRVLPSRHCRCSVSPEPMGSPRVTTGYLGWPYG